MENVIIMVLVSSGMFLCFFYLIANMYWQRRAVKKLEDKIRSHRKILEERFKKQNNELSNVHNNEDIDYEILLMLLREEINELPENTDKKVIKKTLDRKNFNNQKQYALKIFSESGMIDSLGFK